MSCSIPANEELLPNLFEVIPGHPLLFRLDSSYLADIKTKLTNPIDPHQATLLLISDYSYFFLLNPTLENFSISNAKA